MLDELFKFPIIMIDGNKEEERENKSRLLGIPSAEEELDIITGEAECPYYHFISVTDRWLPTERSYQLALEGKFEACSVMFYHTGTFVVPWPKEKFKKELSKFIKKLNIQETNEDSDTKQNIRVLNMTKKEFLDTIKGIPNEEGEE